MRLYLRITVPLHFIHENLILLKHSNAIYNLRTGVVSNFLETLKEFRNILLDQQIQIHTAHRSLTYETFNTERVHRWRLILKEWPLYIKGERNIVADDLSRIDLSKSNNMFKYVL